MTGFSDSALRVPALTCAAAIGLFLLVQLWATLHANALLRGIDTDKGRKVNVEVYMDFEPERFHLEKFQLVGRYLGWQQDHVVIDQADPVALRKLARNYWIRQIRAREVNS